MVEAVKQINTSANLEENTKVTLLLMVQKKEIRIGNSQSRLEITATDSDGIVIINFWDKLITPMDKFINEGSIYSFSGTTKLYNNRIDINGLFAEAVIDNKADYIPRYEITLQQIKEFDTMINYLPERNKQLVESLTGYNTNAEKWNKFLNIPVTERNHYNKIGGLFIKTLNTTKLVSRIIKNYPINIVDNKRLITKALLHDIGKLDEFVLDLSTYVVKKIERNVGHNITGAMKIIACNDQLKLFDADEIDDIAYSIMCHSGELETKTIEDDILYSANTLDVKIFNSMEVSRKIDKIKS